MIKLSARAAKVNFLLFLLSVIATGSLFGQCPNDILYGQNIVLNPEFTNGYSNWTYTADPTRAAGYNAFSSAPSYPGDIYPGTSPNTFNGGFTNFSDHSSSTDNMMLMVDGICVANIKLWEQTVNVSPATNYYFSVWIHTLKDFAAGDVLATLRFDVAGTNLGNINAPRLLADGWIQFETVWNSGINTGPVAISIENTTLTECATKIDFAIDDIAFIPGCGFGVVGPQPNLGPDQTLCGKGGSITLDANVPHNATTTVTWNDGTTGTGLAAPYTKTITGIGTYSVCVTDGGSCLKSDVIVITNTLSISIGANVNLCSVNTTLMDAGFSGIGVTYKWYKNYPTIAPGNSDRQTYSANAAGTYRVDVSAPGCATVSSSKTVSSSNSATPIDDYYCLNGATPHLAVTGGGTYTWYDASIAGSVVTTGLNYTLPAITDNPADHILYVEDSKVYSGTVGPTSEFSSGATAGNSAIYNLTQNGILFSPAQNFKLNSLQVPFKITAPNGTTDMTVSIVLRVYTASPAPGGTATATISAASNTVTIPYNTSAFTFFTFNFTNFTIPVSLGSNLILKIESVTTAYDTWRFELGNRSGITPNPFIMNSVVTDLPGVVSISGSLSGNTVSTTNYFGLYNWNISATTPCSRVPVRALNNCPLPVIWRFFDITPLSNNTCKLKWITATESDNKYYTVERTGDGVNFEVIGRVEGAGNSSITSEYYLIDHKPLSGTSYYKIVQHDGSGELSSSEIKKYAPDMATPFQIKMYPNPFEVGSALIVNGPGEDKGVFRYNIFSVLGQQLETGNGSYGEKIIVGENLTKGVYFLDVKVNKEVQSFKLVKN